MLLKLRQIFKKIRSKFLGLKISTKIMLFYFALLIFSILLSSALYQNFYSDIMSRKVSEVSLQTLYSINSSISLMVENSKNLSKVIIASEEVQEPLRTVTRHLEDSGPAGKDSPVSSAMSINLDSQRKINSHVSKFIEAFPFITAIYIFDNMSQRYGVDVTLLKSLKYDDIDGAGWYGEAVNANGGYLLRLNAGGALENTTEDKYISLIRIINDIYTQKPIGTLLLNISESSFVSSYSDIVNKYDTDIMILDGSGQSIVSFRNPLYGKIGAMEASDNASFGSRIEKIGNTEYLVSFLDIAEYDWRIVSVMPFKELSKESSIFSVIAFAVIAVNSLLLFLGSVLVSRMITTPIKKLLKSMKGVEKGEFRKVSIRAGNDEIGKLRDGYNIMISEIQGLIHRVVEDQKIKRKAELDVLQAQIKPHFLYNTFDALGSLALSGKKDEVYRVLKALGSYYRTSLNRGSEVITIGEEIEVVRNYLTIQKMRFGDIFEVNYDVDERVKGLKILKLILQPLVENALYHGIKPGGERGTIGISAGCDRGMVVLAVEDDGVGMEEEEVKRILLGKFGDSKASYGLKGTIERLRIFYGVNDLFSIHSKKGVGTKVVISIPVKEEKENEG